LGRDTVAVSFTGDGGSNQGTTFEAMNMAVVLQLPAIFVFENNQYGEGTPFEYAVGSRDIAGRAAGFGLPAVKVNGDDFFEVHEAAREAVERARAGGGPTLLECRTYRHYGHSKADPGKYRPKAEVEHWLARDPLPRARERLLAEGVGEEELAAVEDDTRARVDRAVAAGKAAPYPDPADEHATEYAP
jgi:pyruvate dehydrogenase E1 component alpha subunit